MKLLHIFFFTTFLYIGNAAAECETGWIAYRDELCIKVFTENLLTYEEAKTFCSSQGTQSTRATLAKVKNSEMQELLANYTRNNFDSLWLGSQYNVESAQFLWEDGEPLTYTNWADGYPRNISDTDICISLRPANAKSSKITEGYWEDVVCQRRNVALCQRTLPWTLEDAVEEIIKLRKQDLEREDELKTVRADLETVNSRVVPVGSIYIEYFNQPSPRSLWPSLSWQDITSTYAGLFFRAQGGGSGAWGTSQNECAPRVSQMSYTLRYGEFPTHIDIPESGWSEYGKSGYLYQNGAALGDVAVRFYTASCEVRPKNQAIRVWKRTA